MPASAPLSAHTALVTGGASGIGRAVAQRLAADGARVLVLDRDEAGARQVADEVDGEHLAADLSDGDAIDALDLGSRGIDILVNNAGLQHVAPVEEFDPARFELIHRVMLLAPFRLARAVLPGTHHRWPTRSESPAEIDALLFDLPALPAPAASTAPATRSRRRWCRLRTCAPSRRCWQSWAASTAAGPGACRAACAW